MGVAILLPWRDRGLRHWLPHEHVRKESEFCTPREGSVLGLAREAAVAERYRARGT
jgi:hypothetical protein